MGTNEGNPKRLEVVTHEPTPAEKIHQFWSDFWTPEEPVEGLGKILIPPLNLTPEEIAAIEEDEDRDIYYVPENVTLEMLDRMFPGMEMHKEIYKMKLNNTHMGWRLSGIIKDKMEGDGIDLREYIILVQSVKSRTGMYIDGEMYSFLPGSSDETHATTAGFIKKKTPNETPNETQDKTILRVSKLKRTGVHDNRINDRCSRPIKQKGI